MPCWAFPLPFDEKGAVLNFLRLEVTNQGNLPWNAQEEEQMNKQLVGRSILPPMGFDPRLGSISSATMNSALILDAINEAKRHYEGLKSMEYIP